MWFSFRVGLALAMVGALSAVLAACGRSEAANCGGLVADNAWVREAPAGKQTMAGYFELRNTGKAAVVVNGVTSTQFDHVQLQRKVTDDNGRAGEQALAQITVDPGATVLFAPGGRRVALLDPSQHYGTGDQVEMVLSCGSQHAELPVAAVVRAEQPAGGGNAGDNRSQVFENGRTDAGVTGDSTTAQ